MTREAREQLDCDIVRHLKLCQEGGTLPNVKFLAVKHDVATTEVEDRMRVMTTNEPKLEGQQECGN